MNAGRYVLIGLCALPMVPVVILWALFGLVAGRSFRIEGQILTWTKRDWAKKVWRWTTRVGFCQLTGTEPGKMSERLKRHEGTHTRQFIDDAVRMLVVALFAWAAGVPLWAALLIYVLGPWLILTNSLTAWLRGWKPYMDSGHEIDARACSASTGSLRFPEYDAKERGVTEREPF